MASPEDVGPLLVPGVWQSSSLTNRFTLSRHLALGDQIALSNFDQGFQTEDLLPRDVGVEPMMHVITGGPPCPTHHWYARLQWESSS